MNNNIWYKEAIIYQLHVKSFFDSNNNGFGDFRGLSEKLDYLKSLGINTIWLLPFYPSPLKDDGYDISNYLEINEDYGNLTDFRFFLKEAHNRNIKIIIELVINHTSDQHSWFQRARKAKKGSKERNYYMWSETNDKFSQARIIFKDFEQSNWQWDPIAKEYYWHRFFSHQPDLNFDNPEVHKEIFKIVDFWFKLGVDGMRLDAIPYLYAREGTNCENLPETHQFLKKLRNHIDNKFKDKVILAEANQWPEDIINYFGEGDECNMAFHFPIMPRLFMALKMEDRFPIIDILEQTPKIPDNCQWVIFLRNHDELTLEMVTDEERDYMYRTYASEPKSRINLGIRKRLAPLLNNDKNQIKLLNSLLFSLNGTPVIYYGDELGMGDNYYLGDRNGVRTPMQWDSSKNAGFSNIDQRELFLPVITNPEYHYESINVENSEKNSDSLLWFMKKLISARKTLISLTKGNFQIIHSNNNKVISFIRKYKDEVVLVIANFSKNPQSLKLYLSEYNTYVPEEVFGKSIFPTITKDPYNLSISELSFYWLQLTKRTEKSTYNVSIIYDSKDNKSKEVFEKKLLKNYLKKNELLDKKLSVKDIEILELIEMENILSFIYVFKVYYNEDSPFIYIACISKKQIFDFNYLDNIPNETILIKINEKNEKEVFFDAFEDINFRKTFFENSALEKNIKINNSNKIIKNTSNSWLIESSSKNYLVNYDNSKVLKIYKSFEFVSRSEIELIIFLNKKGFKYIPKISNIINYYNEGKKAEIGVIQDFIINEGNFWDYSSKEISLFFEKILFKNINLDSNLDKKNISSHINHFYINLIEKLANRVSEMHILLASDHEDINFAPEKFTFMYQRSIYQSVKSELKKVIENIENSHYLTNPTIKGFIKNKSKLIEIFKQVLSKNIDGLRIRNHGDFNLKQILFTGKDFVFVDFDGISIKAFSERKIKRSCLREIASLLRSFHYLAYTSIEKECKKRFIDPNKFNSIAEILCNEIFKKFLDVYLLNLEKSNLIPKSKDETKMLLNILLINKFLSSVNYEIDKQSESVIIPIMGINNILKGEII
ncbi:MAG: maltose alpha-D-glucosyltransferase [Candidatus Sericytochromatia bacterium]